MSTRQQNGNMSRSIQHGNLMAKTGSTQLLKNILHSGSNSHRPPLPSSHYFPNSNNPGASGHPQKISKQANALDRLISSHFNGETIAAADQEEDPVEISSSPTCPETTIVSAPPMSTASAGAVDLKKLLGMNSNEATTTSSSTSSSSSPTSVSTNATSDNADVGDGVNALKRLLMVSSTPSSSVATPASATFVSQAPAVVVNNDKKGIRSGSIDSAASYNSKDKGKKKIENKSNNSSNNSNKQKAGGAGSKKSKTDNEPKEFDHFAGSKFMTSPDPTNMPMPDFDESMFMDENPSLEPKPIVATKDNAAASLMSMLKK